MEAPVASKGIAKKIDKLEKEADKLRKKAEKKGKELTDTASDRIDELRGEEKSSKKGVVALLLAAGAAIGFALKRKRDQELDEALWEEPRSL
jgi:F0F1-type ATP synthase membrane subunit b/b'